MDFFYKLMRELTSQSFSDNVYGKENSNAIEKINTSLENKEWVRVILHRYISDIMTAFSDSKVRFVAVIFENPSTLVAWLQNGGVIKHVELVALSLEEVKQLPQYKKFAHTLSHLENNPEAISFCISSFVKMILSSDCEPVEYPHSNTVLLKEVLNAAQGETQQMKEMYPAHLQ